MCPLASALFSLIMATCSVNMNADWFKQPLPPSVFTQRLSKVWWSISCMCCCCDNVHVCVAPSSNHSGSVTASPLSNSIFDPSLKTCSLISPVHPQHQQQAWWHSRWQWPQERRVHPQQQSTLAPYRHRPLDEAICRGHLWGDDIISSQPIKIS